MSYSRITRNHVVETANVRENPDGTRTIWWSDGVSRTYTREQIATMFLEGYERGRMNPLLDKLVSYEEKVELMRAVDLLQDRLSEVIAAAIPHADG